MIRAAVVVVPRIAFGVATGLAAVAVVAAVIVADQFLYLLLWGLLANPFLRSRQFSSTCNFAYLEYVAVGFYRGL